ncbi:hypothetical protein CC79DRAFT_1322400 [Sarocladium strictum]
MEESPPKRRRTSPRLSQTARDTTPGRERTSGSQINKRPSFASPTKASLSKHNPQILERRRSASPNKSSPTRPVPRRRPSDAASEQSIADLLAAQLESDAASAPPSETNRLPPRSPGPSSTAPSSAGTVPRFGGALAGTPRRSPAKPNPRPLPPPAPDGQDDLNPFIGYTLRRSPTTGVNIPPRPEPELPPSVPDAVSSTPPKGIHTSSPSRWRQRGKAVGDSPLKRPPLRPSDEDENEEPTAKRLFSPRATKSNVRASAVLGQVSDNPRRVVPYDPHSRKRKRVEKLREEVRRSIGLVNEKDTIITVQKHLMPGTSAQPRQSELLAKAAINPMGLLPFTKPLRPTTSPNISDEKDEAIRSHYPLQMTADTELPYLQLFGSFDVTSTVAMMAPTPDGTFRQRHLITLRSLHVPGFFTSRIEMIVNAMNLTILELRVVALEPAAKAELGDFVEKVCSGDCNRSMQRNIGVLSWAMGDWLRVALQRASLWAQLDRELAAKGGMSTMASKARARKPKNRSPDEDGPTEMEDVSKRDLLRFMGQQSFTMTLGPTEETTMKTSVRLHWKIKCDWTGEAESAIDVAIGVPGKWHHIDAQGALGKLPRLFSTLVEGGETTVTAVRSVVALLVGEA